jgi:superfamily II DNA or RNA helicase
LGGGIDPRFKVRADGMDISDELIRATVTASAYAAGQAYMRAGRVLGVQADEDARHMSAEVKGSARRPYRLTIDLHRTKSGAVSIAGECTCTVGFNCKHVAAALLKHRQAAAVAAAPAPRPRVLAEDFSMAGARAPSFRMRAEDAPPTAPAPAAGQPKGAALSPLLAAWVQNLSEAAEADSEAYPEGVSKRVFYMLRPANGGGGASHQLDVVVAIGELRRSGEIKPDCRQADPYQLMAGVPAKHLRPSDKAILRVLASQDEAKPFADTNATLAGILATGRARLGEFPGVAARQGEARAAALEWRIDEDGAQRPALDVAGGGVAVLVPEPWYVDSATGEVGPVTIGIPPALLHGVLAAPPVPPAQAGAVRKALSAALKLPLPAPRELEHGGALRGPPAPHLRLHRMPAPAYASQFDALPSAGATLRFRYGPALAPLARGATELVHGGKRYTLTRDKAAEDNAAESLAKQGFRTMQTALPYLATPSTQHCFVLPGRNPEQQWLDFMLTRVPALRRAGWEITEDADFSYRVVTPTGPMQAELREGTGIDWFELDLGVMVGGERVDLVPPLLRLLADPDTRHMLDEWIAHDRGPKRPFMVELADGRRVALERATLQPILTTLFDLFSAGGVAEQNGRLGVARHGAADISRLERAGLAANLVWAGGEALRALGRQLETRGGIPEVLAPKWFTASLRDYQQRGVDWLQFLRQAGLAGVLADDMGLGKTVQTLAHLSIEKAAGRARHPALVICPTSVVGNWAREAARFAPKLRVLALQGSDRKSRFGSIGKYDLVISTYPLLARDEAVLSAQDWSSLVLDEAQTVKNPAATMAQTVRRLNTTQRICLTGTPMENHLGELWALFDFMMPGFLGSAQEFGRRFRGPIERNGDADLHEALARRVSPFLLRRTKSEVAKELPPRTEIVENVQMQASQRAVYEAVRLAMHERVQDAIANQGLAKSGIVILDALLKMRQVCCDPRLLKFTAPTKHKPGSAKLDRLLELLTTLQDEGRSILLFSQFTSMLALIEDAIRPLEIPYAMLTGDTKDRRKPVDDFQAGRAKLFLISLKAGGVGLNLTAADTVIHYDPWWNPAVENQATDRAHRIGQTKSVFVHRLITENTIEEKMEVLKARKSALADGILSGAGSGALKMTEDDVEMLFG